MKNSVLTRICLLLTAVVLVTAAVLFAVLIRYDRASESSLELYPLEIVGEYSEEGGEWKPLTREVFFQNLTYRDITVRGHFTRDLPENSKLFLNVDHLRMSLRVNGAEVFFIGPVEGDGNPTRAAGKQWVTVHSPGITTEDMVEMNFGNLYKNAYLIQFDELLWQMHTGDELTMLFRAIQLDGWTIGVGAIFLFLTLFLLAISIGCLALHIKGALRFFWLGLSTLFASLWFFTLSPAPTMIVPLPIFLNVLYTFAMQSMATFIILFVIEHLSGWRRQSLNGCVGLLLLLMLIALVNQALQIQDLYTAINWFSIFDVAIALWLIYCIGFEAYRLKSAEAHKLLRAMLPLVLAAVIELVNGYIQFSKAAILLGLGLIAFTVMEGVYTLQQVQQSMENEKRALVLENELQQSNIRIMLSQIQPHFLYNSLVGIKELCDTGEQQTTSNALEHFAYYLRGNLDSLSDKQLIPFSREVSHVRDYLYLEKMRFEDKLGIVWDLQFTDFLLPSITLQPIVENAVRHGITAKKGGGTLTIHSEEASDSVTITVTDDGMGFDMTKSHDDGRTHIGIDNVRKRLAAQCGGSLYIESERGIGTTVKIILPRTEVLDYENHSSGR